MSLEVNIIKERLRETFGTDSQETVGKKLNMTQGNVSKLLSGVQQPTLETIYHVAKIYEVSVDWILGISDNKKVYKRIDGATYATAIQNLRVLTQRGALKIEEQANSIVFKLIDPLIKMLIKKSITLSETDKELFRSWEESKLAQFQDREIVWEGTWSMKDLDFLAGEATTESNWLEVLDRAKEIEDEYADMMGEDTGPFGG